MKIDNTLLFTILALTLFALLNDHAWGSSLCNRHPIYCHIVKVKPTIDKAFAMEVSNLFYKYSKWYSLNPHVSVAICMQESGFRDVTVRNHRGRRVYSRDIGICQLNSDTIRHYGLDAERIENDLEYHIKSHFKIRARKERICRALRARLKVKRGTEWSCYHSYTYEKRMVYIQKVRRYNPMEKHSV